jgi:hypothetical protein
VHLFDVSHPPFEKKKTIAISDAAGSSRDWTLEGRIRKR